MSTLAAARADNMYYPPEWRPEMGGISKFQGSKGANQYEQYGKIRFELPVHGWCLGCGRHIARGTRFNAKKDQAGTYYTTKIWQFSMKCPSCSTVLIIKTDPKNTDYEYVEGIRKKDMAFDPEEAETQRVQDSEVSNQLAVDPLYRLEHEQADKRRAASRKTALTRLTELSDLHGRDDYSANAALRQGMRSRKKKDKERDDEARAKGLGIRLVTPSPADAEAARKIKYSSRHKSFKNGQKMKMAALSCQSIFGAGQESLEQARRKALLIKAAKRGITAKEMKLLEPGVAMMPSTSRTSSRVRNSSSSDSSNSKYNSATGVGVVCGAHHSSVQLPQEESRTKRRNEADEHGVSRLEVDAFSPFEVKAGTTHDVVVKQVLRDARKKRRRHDRSGDDGSKAASVDDPKKLFGDTNDGRDVRGGEGERQYPDHVSPAVHVPSRLKEKQDSSSREKKRPKSEGESSKGSRRTTSAVRPGGLAAIANMY